MFFRKKRQPSLSPTQSTVETLATTGKAIVTETKSLPVVEEQLDISKLNVPGETVKARTITDEVQETVSMNLRREHYDVVRVAIDQVVDTVPEIRREDGRTIIPVMEERLVTTKQLVLVEEIHIREDHEVVPHEETVTLRKQRAVVERITTE